MTGEIAKEDYQNRKAEIAQEVEKLENQLTFLKQLSADRMQTNRTLELAKKAAGENVTNRELVEMLIDKVYVFPNKHVEIRWKVQDFATDI